MASPQRQLAHVAVHMLFRDTGGSLLLARRRKTGFCDGLLFLVSGHVEEGETVCAAGVREAAEEVGLTIKPSGMRVATVMHRPSPGTGRVYVDAFVVYEPPVAREDVTNLEPDKCAGLEWHGLPGLPNDTVDYIAHAVKCTQDGTSWVEWGWD